MGEIVAVLQKLGTITLCTCRGGFHARPSFAPCFQVLSLADRASAALVCDTGLLPLAKRHLMSRPPTPLRFPPAFSQVLRLWRTCALYGRGGGSFSDYYGALAVVLEPPAGGRPAAGAAPWKESAEAYLLLEALARTLPKGREDESGDEERAEVLLDWATAGPLVETASKWLSPDVVAALPEKGTSPGGATLLHALAAVLHFLATVAERNAGQLGRLERTLLAALLAGRGVLCTASPDAGNSGEVSLLPDGGPGPEREVPASGPVSFFQALSDRVAQPGSETGGAMAAASCLQGLLRLTSALAARERLGAERASEAAGPSPAGRSVPGGPALGVGGRGDEGSLASIEERMALSFGGLTKLLTAALGRARAREVQEEDQRPAAAGVGLGWGLPAQRVWAEGLLVQSPRADLLAALYETFPLDTVGKGEISARSPAAGSEPSSGREMAAEGGASMQAIQRLRAGLAAIRMMGPGDFKPVLALLSSAILSTDVLEVLLGEAGALLEKTQQDVHSTSPSGRGSLPSAAEVRRVLLPHFASQWLSRTAADSDEGGGADGWDVEKEVGKVLDADDSSMRERDPEDHSGGSISGRPKLEPSRTSTSGTAASLTASISGQKLPLPADWILSPTAVAAQLSSSTVSEAGSSDIEDGVKKLVRAGLALLLGLETCERLERHEGQREDTSNGGELLGVPLVRKLHALSEAFLAAGDLFLDSEVAPLLEALQELYGGELPPVPSNKNTASAEATRQPPTETNLDSPSRRDQRAHDFTAAAGAPYEGFAEGLAEHFAATSFGDLKFGRQVALLLRDVTPGALRLVVWRALADARALHLLPPAGDCLGDPRAYTSPSEVSPGSRHADVRLFLRPKRLDVTDVSGSQLYRNILHISMF